MKTIEQQLQDEKRVNQAIIDLLDEALQNVGYKEDVINGLTVSGKIDFLVRAAQQIVQRTDGNVDKSCPIHGYDYKGMCKMCINAALSGKELK